MSLLGAKRVTKSSWIKEKPFDTKQFASHLLLVFIRRALILGLSVTVLYYALEIFKNAGLGNDFKFEIKTAQDVKTKLSDVRGINEIRDEIDDLIKMIHDPEIYR